MIYCVSILFIKKNTALLQAVSLSLHESCYVLKILLVKIRHTSLFPCHEIYYVEVSIIVHSVPQTDISFVFLLYILNKDALLLRKCNISNREDMCLCSLLNDLLFREGECRADVASFVLPVRCKVDLNSLACVQQLCDFVHVDVHNIFSFSSR
uniref:Uncharacterized protein n=1 Tax=Myoviridae sp. ctqfO1 TaxID=2827710 RepID=A0A8S5T2W9_9CAUD|nr:MAG TPA: hypothetical protein [Myoviridae sp. ctqfO1]